MAIRALGSASGLDLESLVTQLVKAERISKEDRLETAKKSLDSSLSGYGKLKSAMSKFQDAVKALSLDNLNARTATVKQPTDTKTYIEATAKNTAAAGVFDIKVKTLAAGSRVESADLAYTSTSDVVSATAGELTFGADGKSFKIDVTAGMTLDQLRQAINSKKDNFGVSANIINGGGTVGTKLVLTSNITGATNDLTITNNNAALDGISTVPNSGGTAGLTVTKPAASAEVIIDGISTFSKTNTFTNALQDTEFKVQNVTPDGNNATLTIATDKKGTEDKLKAFIDNYNALVTEVEALTKNRVLGPDGKSVVTEGGALNNDPTVRSMLNMVTSALGKSVPSASAGLNNLYSLGITMTSNGRLEISSSKVGSTSGRERMDSALKDNFDGIAKLFGNSDGFNTTLNGLLSQFTQKGGLLENKETSLRNNLTKNAKDLEIHNRYIESYEATLRQRYGALDTQLGQLQGTSSMLSSQLASLPRSR
ncbi:flagellar filament capping protein FliD [Rheinheimera sp.]|uniref:flagellar filament capping protein FliD n=1 Tax=Rheinheimera sp. TaxID=1869214 RepID=UPI003D29FFBE